MDAAAVAWEAAPKAAYYAALAVSVGVIVARWLLDRAALPGLAATRLGTLAALAACALFLSCLLRLMGHTVAAFGSADAWSTENIQLIALESRWGVSWRLQTIAAAALTMTAIAIRLRGGRGWRMMALAVLLSIASTPLLGHAAGSMARGALHAAHVLGSSAWLGTLIAIVLVDWMSATPGGADASHAGPGRAMPTARLVERFSPVALTAAAAVFATGVVAAFIYLTSPADLLHTAYGRALSIKLAMVLAILACGYANWQRARAREAPWVPLLRVEAALALLVLVVTSVLTELEHP